MRILSGHLAGLAFAGLAAAALVSGARGEDIKNTASLSYSDGGQPVTIASNTTVLQRAAAAPTFAVAGYIFDIRDGAPISGLKVDLIDVQTNTIVQQAQTAAPAISAAAAQIKPVSGSDPDDDPLDGGAGSLDPGQYRFSGVKGGWYRVDVELPPGWQAAVGAGNAAVDHLVGPDGRALSVDADSFGGSFLVAANQDLTVDIPLQSTLPPQIIVEKTADVADISAGDTLGYHVRLVNQSGAGVASQLSLVDVLPRGFRYVAGSLRLSSARTAEPSITPDGRTLKIALPDLLAGAELELSYRVRAGLDVSLGDALNSATAISAGSYKSAPGLAIVKVRSAFIDERITILGEVSAGPCEANGVERRGVPNVRVVLETGAWALTDRNGLYHFEGVRPGVHVAQLDTESLPPGAQPLACPASVERGGSAISQFIDAAGGAIAQAHFRISALAPVEPTPAPAPAAAPADPAAPAAPPTRDDAAFHGLQPGADWVLPKIGFNPDAPALHVAIKHLPGDEVSLRVDGQLVLATTYQGAMPADDPQIEISQWRGVVLKEGDNLLEANVKDASGKVAHLRRVVHYANTAARAVLAPELSRLIADGSHKPAIAVRILDAAGHPVRKGVTGGVRVASPYKLAGSTAAQQQRQLAGTEKYDPVYHVSTDDGLAIIELDPTSSAGWVDLTFDFPGAIQARPDPVRAWLSASREDWILVGYAAGTAGFNTLAHNIEQLPSDEQKKTFSEGQTAFYAKGRVLGRWLLTMAYDSGKHADDASLMSVIDPDRYYSLYGDASSVGYDAPSASKLYLRLERDQFYAMFGDFETGFTDTELGRYSRTLNGVKIERAGRLVQVSAFAAETAQHNVRDEIPGAGLSGPYRLSSGDIIANTDVIRIETRDRYRSERVIAARTLARHIDYDIDYDAATVLFREPILSKDADFNPQYIVAEYEIYGDGQKKLSAGARATTELVGGRLKLGLTAISSNQDNAQKQLAEADAVVRITPDTRLHVEAAASTDAPAYVAELQHSTQTSELVAYYRQQGQNFGVGQAPLGQADTRKYGLDVRQKLAANLSVSGTAFQEASLDTDAERTYSDVRIEQKSADRTVFGGARYVEEQGATGPDNRSESLLAGVSQSMLDHRLELTEASDVMVAGSAEDPAFPTRHRFGARYEVMDGVRLIGAYEVSPGKTIDSSAAQVGFEVQPWAGARLASTLSQSQVGENGARTFAQYGLSQSLPIGKQWTVDASYDGAQAVSGAANAQSGLAATPSFDAITPRSSFQAVTSGATYRSKTWSWNARVEYRSADSGDRLGIISNLLKQVDASTSLAAGVRAFDQTDASDRATQLVEGRLAYQWRPPGRGWVVFNRAVLRYDARDAGAAGAEIGAQGASAGNDISSRIVNDFAVGYDDGSSPWSGSAHYGAKYVANSDDDVSDTGFIDVLGADLARRLSPAFELALQANVRHAAGRQLGYSMGPSLGWSPGKNTWLSFGYNMVGFRDRDFEENRYTRQGAYITFRLKVDQTSIADVHDFLRGR